MKTDKPLVSVLLAAYKPNEKWFREQLISLNKQDYPNIELLIWDDCPDEPIDENIVKECITNFSYSLYRGEENKGSNYAFEELTRLGRGEFFSYCDHDDIWCENKISSMVDALQSTKSPLVCCDAYIIDSTGKKIGDCLKDVYKRHEFLEGENLAVSIVSRNFVMGCAMLVRAQTAKTALPFPKEFVHDHWIAVVAAFSGKVEVIKQPLLYHRKHENNQTGVLLGVVDKQSYYEKRLLIAKKQIDKVKDTFDTKNNEDFLALSKLTDARVRYYNNPNLKDYRTMSKYSYMNKYYVLFEKFAPFFPNIVIKEILKLLQKGKI